MNDCYADDIALLEGDRNRAQEQLEKVARKAAEVGLEINVGKTKQMIINPENSPQLQLSLNHEQIEIVNDFKYLGSMVASTEKDIRVRKGQAWIAFWKIKNLWSTQQLPIQLKVRFFKAACLSILLYEMAYNNILVGFALYEASLKRVPPLHFFNW